MSLINKDRLQQFWNRIKDAYFPENITSGDTLATETYVNDSINQMSAYYITSDSDGNVFRTKLHLLVATKNNETYYGSIKRVPTKNDYTLIKNYDNNHSEYCGQYDFSEAYSNVKLVFYTDKVETYSGDTITTSVTYDNNFECDVIIDGDTISFKFYKQNENADFYMDDEAYFFDEETLPNTSARFVYQKDEDSDGKWAFQYTVNATSFTQAQLDALNSTITSAKVEKIDNLPIEQGSGSNSIVQKGGNNIAEDNNSVAIGYNTYAGGSYSFSQGYETSAITLCSHAEGENCYSGGRASHAEGEKSYSGGRASHTEGQWTSAITIASHAEGRNTLAKSNPSHAEGLNTIAEGEASHAEGHGCYARGDRAHAEGYSTSAMTRNSHTEGGETLANGAYSHAEGNYTIAQNLVEHAGGRYNNSKKVQEEWGGSGNTLYSIGIGSDNSNRRNAIEIMQDGKFYIKDIGGYTGTTIGGSVKTVQTVINGILNALGLTYEMLNDFEDNSTDNTTTNRILVLPNGVTSEYNDSTKTLTLNNIEVENYNNEDKIIKLKTNN